jgi:hypothetical protein
MTDTLWQSFANTITAAGEAGAVQSAIEQALTDGAAAGVRASDDEWNYENWSDEEEWILSYSIQSIRIRRAAVPGTALGTLSIALSFYRPEDRAGEGWTGGRRAKIYVGVAPKIKAWDQDTLLLDGSGASEMAQARGGRRWWRNDTPSAWFFCVAMDAVDSREALVRELMRPLGALLTGADEEVAFEGCTATLMPPHAP